MISKFHISEKICLLSFLPEKSNSCTCGYNTTLIFFFFFLPVSSRTNPDEFPHLVSTGSNISGSAAESSRPAVQYCKFGVCSDLTHQFGLLQCGPASHSVGGRFEKKKTQGMGMTQQQGVQPEFLLAPLSWEPSGRRRGARSAVKSPTCLGT